MKVAKDGIRSIVHIGYDGRVHKKFRGTDNDKRYANEVRVLKVLEARGCDYVPRLLDQDDETLTLITTNCGAPAEKTISDKRAGELFQQLEDEYGVAHDDPFPRNITYNDKSGKFCVIDFELAEVKEDPQQREDSEEAHRKLEWFGVSVEGTRKKGNQDALSVFSSEKGWAANEELIGEKSIDDDGVIFAVSDGMGGSSGGDVASSLVVRELRRFLPTMMGDFQGVADPHKLLGDAVSSLHDFVTRVGDNSEHLGGMGATVVCGLFYHTSVYFAHVGDSRFYRWRKGGLEQLTYDHTFVGRDFREGKMSELESRMHPRKNVLHQAIGAGCQFVKPQVDSSTLEQGDWFLICSDGVTDGLWNKHIDECLAWGAEADRDASEVGERILEMAMKEAGSDDTTMFVVKVV